MAEELNKHIDWTECFYNQDRFSKLMIYLREQNGNLYDTISLNLKLKSEAENLILNNKSNNEVPGINTEEELNELLDNKGNRRLVVNTGDVLAESIIVDLMNSFYNLNSKTNNFEINNNDHEPKKIVLLFDNFENINFSLWNWLLNSLIPYCTLKKFSEFISYDISHTVQFANVSDYLNFRIVITCRENFLLKKNNSEFSFISDNCININLEPISQNEIADYFDNININASRNLNEIFAFTKGIPLIINLISESYSSGSFELDKPYINEKVSKAILYSKTEEEKDWIRCASFLDYFDASGLRCFPQINRYYKEVFEYFFNSTELSNHSPGNSNKLKLNDTIKEIVSESVRAESGQLAKEYERISQIYYNCSELFEKFREDEFNVLRNLAYFKCFNKKNALESTFKTDAQLAKHFINKYPDMFVQNKYTLSLKQNYSERLMYYNKLADVTKYEQKIELIKDAWDDYSGGLTGKVNSLQNDLNKLNASAIEIQNDIKSYKKNYLNDQA